MLKDIFYHERGPITKDGPSEPSGYYFWFEDGEYNGPYDTPEEAKTMQVEYSAL